MSDLRFCGSCQMSDKVSWSQDSAFCGGSLGAGIKRCSECHTMGPLLEAVWISVPMARPKHFLEQYSWIRLISESESIRFDMA